MILNLDLVRALLLEAEGKQPGESYRRDWTGEEAETLLLLKREGFIEAEDLGGAGGKAILRVIRLEFSGHMFLKDIRNDEVYFAVKTKLSERLKDWSIAVLAQFAAEYTKNLAGG